jgi:prepilin-type N-terminal cleavage/methylation domain-containing protein
MTRRVNQAGFTLIELLLALAFVAFVLIFATTTIIQVMRTYNKGLAVKEINQTARATTEDITRIIKGSNPSVIVTSPLTTNPSTSKGRVCFGGVSYVWNFTNATLNQYTDNSRINFARVDDPGSALCVLSAGVYPKVNKAQATELLSSNVWVQQLNITPTVGGTFYDVFIQLSTVDDPANPAILYSWANPALEKRVACKGGNLGQFCAVASFSTSVNARGGTN